jgi:hypothetical protein
VPTAGWKGQELDAFVPPTVEDAAAIPERDHTLLLAGAAALEQDRCCDNELVD